MKTQNLRNFIGPSPWQGLPRVQSIWIIRGFFLIPLLLACFALSPTARALLPPPAPDGGYPNNNTAEGTGALFSLTTGVNNAATGWLALFSNTSGSRNTATGLEALVSNTTGHDNTANGYHALFSNNTGQNNTANGVQALYSNTSGYYNTANGVNALYHNNRCATDRASRRTAFAGPESQRPA